MVADPTPGQVVTVEGWKGLWRVHSWCKSGSGCVWVLPCDGDGRWNKREGFRACRPDRLRERPTVRTKRAYKRKAGGGPPRNIPEGGESAGTVAHHHS